MPSNNVKVADAVRAGRNQAAKKDIAPAAGLAWGTMCKTVDQLLERGILFTLREKSTAPGRPSIPLGINAESGYWCGIDIGSSRTRIVFTDFNFNVIRRDCIPTLPFRDEETLHARLRELFETSFSASGLERKRLAGVGLAVSGIVDSEQGMIVSGGNWGLRYGGNLDVAAIAAVLGLPVYAVTSQAAAVTAEYRFGRRAGCANLVTVGLGVGIGSGVISNHQLLISHPRRPVGYIGHILVPGNHRLCSCGFRGCLESCSGGNYLARVAEEELPGRPELRSAAALDRAAEAGDPDAVRIMATAAEYNAAGVAAMIQLYAPDALVFSGGQCRNDGFLYRTTLEKLSGILPEERRRPVELSGLGEYQAALGAARLAYEQFF